MPPEATLPHGKYETRALLAAVGHTLALERGIEVVGGALRALGLQVPPQEEARVTAVERLQRLSWVCPGVHCMAQVDGSSGGLQTTLERLLAPPRLQLLTIEYQLAE